MNQSSILLISAALLALCFVMLIVVLFVLASHRRKNVMAIQRVEKHLSESLQLLEEAQYQQAAIQREEYLRSLHQLNESLVNTFSNLSRTQNDHMNAVIRQSYDNAQAFDQRQQNLQQMVAENLRQMEVRMENLRRTTDENLRNLRDENAKKLSEIRSTVDEKLNETLEKRLSSSFSQVSERLEQVYKSLGEVHSLASGVGDLKRMLSNVKTRGVWGEIQLGALLEQVLTENQYKRNVAVVPHSSERVEYAVCLPGREDGVPVYLAIDSKFPQEDYARLAEAAEEGNQEAVEYAQKALLAAVRTEAKRIGKYIAPPYTTDFAVMFLPLEGLYAEVMRHSDAVESIQREQRILIAGPSTLFALLNSLQMGFRTLAIEKRSAEVWKLLGAVKSDFAGFAALLHKTQEKLQQATDSIDTAFVKTRNIEKRLRNVEALETNEAQKMLSNDEEA
ncbi:MAG: DNA recombination protein RmuC [Clostridia bacterium]|nr:DNA recombination protein RmuC [Clostridia bacterium]